MSSVASESDPLERGDTQPTTTSWRDRKRYAWLLGLIVPLLPFISWGLVEATGLGVFWFYGPVLIFGVFPLLDLLVGTDAENPPDSVIKWLEQDRYYRWCTYLFLPLQYAGLIFACWMWAHGGLSTLESIGLALTIAMVAGIAINTAHELGHKRASSERWLSQGGAGADRLRALLRRAQPRPPRARRHAGGSRQRAAGRELLRVPAAHGARQPALGAGDRTRAPAARRARLLERPQRHPQRLGDDASSCSPAWPLAFGPVVLPYLLIQAVIGFCLLEVVNYLEHYGLLRAKREDGRYERCRPEHSWNSNNVASNVLLYHLQRHSDHHANPLRRYQALRHFDEAPQLPTGYAGMIVLAAIPPLWRRIMDRRLIEHYDGDLSQMNIHPRTRRRVLARYGRGGYCATTCSHRHDLQARSSARRWHCPTRRRDGSTSKRRR